MTCDHMLPKTDGPLYVTQEGDTIAWHSSGLIVANPAHQVKLVRWCGCAEELRLSPDGALVMPIMVDPSAPCIFGVDGKFEFEDPQDAEFWLGDQWTPEQTERMRQRVVSMTHEMNVKAGGGKMPEKP